MKALVVQDKVRRLANPHPENNMSQGKANLRDWPVPSLAPNEVLVKVIYAASVGPLLH